MYPYGSDSHYLVQPQTVFAPMQVSQKKLKNA